MEAIFAAERRLGSMIRATFRRRRRWDIESRDHRTGHLRFIEVKGRHEDAGTQSFLTKNEVLAALNAPDAFILAIVRVAKAYTHETRLHPPSALPRARLRGIPCGGPGWPIC